MGIRVFIRVIRGHNWECSSSAGCCRKLVPVFAVMDTLIAEPRDPPNAAIAIRFYVDRHWRGVGEFYRSTRMYRVTADQIEHRSQCARDLQRVIPSVLSVKSVVAILSLFEPRISRISRISGGKGWGAAAAGCRTKWHRLGSRSITSRSTEGRGARSAVRSIEIARRQLDQEFSLSSEETLHGCVIVVLRLQLFFRFCVSLGRWPKLAWLAPLVLTGECRMLNLILYERYLVFRAATT